MNSSANNTPPIRRKSRVYFPLVEALRRQGHDANLVGPAEFGGSHCAASQLRDRSGMRLALRDYLRARASAYDVVDYDHSLLPFPRAAFPDRPLFVARSVLLTHLLAHIAIPRRPGLRYFISGLVTSHFRRMQLRRAIAAAEETASQADFLNLCNEHERTYFRERGVPLEKMAVLPFGLTEARAGALEAVPLNVPKQPMVAFVGTFDPRKGMREFPRIVAEVSRCVPDVQFRLLGTKGFLADEAAVRRCFSQSPQHRLEIRPTFEPAELPSLLDGCSLGVYPSRLEGFPFGVLEMLAAGLPVIAYDAPGAPMMINAEWLVPVGDVARLAAIVSSLLRDHRQLAAAKQRARELSRRFRWDDIAERTVQAYQCANDRRNGKG